jgi:hypothetical protein
MEDLKKLSEAIIGGDAQSARAVTEKARLSGDLSDCIVSRIPGYE